MGSSQSGSSDADSSLSTDSSDPSCTRILVIEDHPAIWEALQVRIEREETIEISGVASTLDEAVEALGLLEPDVVVLDISLEEGDGFEFLRTHLSTGQPPQVVVYTMHDEQLFADQALRSGALGYVMKSDSSDAVVEAIKTVRGGEVYLSDSMTSKVIQHTMEEDASPAFPIDSLTSRERSVCELISRDMDVASIAEELDLSVKTIEAYRRQAKEKLGFGSTAELRQFLLERQIYNS